MNLTKTIKKIFTILIVMYPNHALFNVVFANTPFVIWKQLSSITLIILTSIYFVRKKNIYYQYYLLLLIFLIIPTIVISIVNGLSIIRIVYGLLFYISGIGFLAYAFVNNGDEKKLNIIVYLGLIGCVGIFIDYSTDFFSFLGNTSGNFDANESVILRRASFLFGASTIVFQFISLSYVLICYNIYKYRNYYYFPIISIVFLLCISFTGSRSALLFGAFLFIYFYFRLRLFYNIYTNIFFSFICFLLISYIFSYLNNIDQFLLLIERLSDIGVNSSDGGNSHRLTRWYQALYLFTEFPKIFGEGIGSTLAMVNDGYSYSTHFESSFFQAFYEGGYLLVLVRYLIPLYCLFIPNRNGSKLVGFLKVWLLVFLLSTAIAPTISAFHNQMILYIVCGYIYLKAKK